MASLDELLRAKDLDDLLRLRGQLSELTRQEQGRVTGIMSEWQDGQAVSNLLFYPSLIPELVRCNSIDRALCSPEQPYFALAAVVGLQSVEPDKVAVDVRKRWVTSLLEFVRSDGQVLSSRASVTIWSWLGDGQLEEFVASYPVPDETATKNIVAFSLSRFGQLTRTEYTERLRSCGLGFFKRRRMVRRFDEYQRKKDSGGAVFMTMPLLSFIPNYETAKS
jgi:hypothetical protein